MLTSTMHCGHLILLIQQDFLMNVCSTYYGNQFLDAAGRKSSFSSWMQLLDASPGTIRGSRLSQPHTTEMRWVFCWSTTSNERSFTNIEEYPTRLRNIPHNQLRIRFLLVTRLIWNLNGKSAQWIANALRVTLFLASRPSSSEQLALDVHRRRATEHALLRGVGAGLDPPG